MRVATIALALTAALCAVAAANPSVGDWTYMSFDPDGDIDQNEMTPEPYTTINAYVIGHFTDWGSDGWTTICFRITDLLEEYPGVVGTQSFVNLLPGNLTIGDPFDSVGVTVASADCLSGELPVAIGCVSCFYLGGSCTIAVLDHGEYARWVVDCQDPGQVFYYDAVGVCHVYDDSPVEDISWGAIKAMYR